MTSNSGMARTLRYVAFLFKQQVVDVDVVPDPDDLAIAPPEAHGRVRAPCVADALEVDDQWLAIDPGDREPPLVGQRRVVREVMLPDVEHRPVGDADELQPRIGLDQLQ